jgi:hypothetical protein
MVSALEIRTLARRQRRLMAVIFLGMI